MRPNLPELSGDFVVNETTVQVGTSPTQLLTQDPNRWALIFGVVVSLANVYVSTQGGVSGQNGILISSQTLPFQLTWRDYGALVQVPWYALALNSPTPLQIITVEYRPQGA